MYKLNLFIKRCFDFVSCLIAVILLTPVWIIVAIAIKLDSKGPVFFKQGRRTKDGRIFQMLKFRSMVVNAENLGTGLFSYDNDPRVTKVGAFLRKTSIDEFPQFFNVLKGDMSLVGTRPPTVDEWEKYELHHRARLAMKPGITGMWQVSGRSSITDFEEIVKLDTYYICNWSLGLDIKILLKTVLAVLHRDGAM
jgi:exopolysaccharide biosynthesis polyprenyl glycosylphosphotransferase